MSNRVSQWLKHYSCFAMSKPPVKRSKYKSSDGDSIVLTFIVLSAAVPELGGLARRAAGCSSAFSAPSPSAHHDPGLCLLDGILDVYRYAPTFNDRYMCSNNTSKCVSN